MSACFPLLQTGRLRLEPVTAELAHAILAGDLSQLSAAQGWPHEGHRRWPGHGGPVRSSGGLAHHHQGHSDRDCGTHGWPDEHGRVEIGYGLAAPYRSQGLGSEAVAAITA